MISLPILFSVGIGPTVHSTSTTGASTYKLISRLAHSLKTMMADWTVCPFTHALIEKYVKSQDETE